MYFRQVNANFESSEVVFKNFLSRTNIQLINFINIGNVVVENTVIQRIDDLDFKNTRDCYFVEADNTRQPVTCNKEDLFYKIRSEQLIDPDLTSNPAFLVPVVLLCAALLIILAVVFFIKIKKKSTMIDVQSLT